MNGNGIRRWKQYPDHRDSGMEWVQQIPSHWRVEKLKYLASVRASNVDKKSVEGQQVVLLCNYVDVYRNEYVTADMDFMGATATDDQIRTFALRNGDVIVTKDSESWDDIAVPAFVSDDLQGVVCGYHLAQIRPKPEVVNGEYLARCFAARGICEQFKVAANGVTRFGLGTGSIETSLFPVPPVEEQEQIVRALRCKTSRIDTLIAKKERLIELLQEKRAALVSHVVTKGVNPRVPLKDSGVDWLGKIPAHWALARMKHVCKLETGHTPRKSEDKFWVPDECTIPWISLNDTKVLESADFIDDSTVKISPLGMKNSAAHLIEKGAVVFNRDGARVGLAAITTKPMCLSQHLIGWVCGEAVHNYYLLHVIYAMEQEIYHLTAGATIPTIGMPDIKKMVMPVPPLEEQKEIAGFLVRKREQLTQLVRRIGENIDRLREYRTALISAAVTGKIDVREEIA